MVILDAYVFGTLSGSISSGSVGMYALEHIVDVAIGMTLISINR